MTALGKNPRTPTYYPVYSRKDNLLTGSVDQPLAGKTILVVEDETVIAMEFEFALLQAGASTVELCFRLTDTLYEKAAAADVVILDLDVRGESSVPVAHHLMSVNTPFVITTAALDEEIDPSIRSIPLVRKPHTPEHLIATVVSVLERRGEMSDS